jgi:hypothetical protein
VYFNHVNLLGENIKKKKKKRERAEILLQTNKEIVIEVDTDKTKYMNITGIEISNCAS